MSAFSSSPDNPVYQLQSTTMLTANPSGPQGSTAIVAVNGLYPSSQTQPQQLINTPSGTLLTTPTNLIAGQSLSSGSFLFPSSSAFAPAVQPLGGLPFSGTGIQSPLLPTFFTPAGLLANPNTTTSSSPYSLPFSTIPVQQHPTLPLHALNSMPPVIAPLQPGAAISVPTLPAMSSSTLAMPAQVSLHSSSAIANSTTVVSVSSSTAQPASIPKSDNQRPPLIPSSMTSAKPDCPSEMLALESVDFHRDAILNAIDRLRERKARPDLERISCLLKRYQNINPDQTQMCLGKLADAGAVVCVDYKGNLSYRNPSKWRKTATGSGSSTMNSTAVTNRLVEALRRLTTGTIVAKLNNGLSDEATPLPIKPGPNGGFSVFQIHRALQILSASQPDARPNMELTGATLRVCLDREATFGCLAKTTDGRYILDESGEKKKLVNLSPNTARPPIAKKSQSLMLLPSTLNIAKDQITSRLPPIAVKQPPNLVSGALPIAPNSGAKIQLPPFLAANRRGRPPGSRAKRPPEQAQADVDKRPKLCLPQKINSPSSQVSNSPVSRQPVTPSPSLSSISQLPKNDLVITSTLFAPQNGLPGPIAIPTPLPSLLSSPTAFHSQPPLDSNQFQPSPFWTFPTPPSGLDGAVQPSIPLPSAPPSAPLPPVVDEASSENGSKSPLATHSCSPTESSATAGTGSCQYCGGSSTKDEAFLVCKDCNQCAFEVYRHCRPTPLMQSNQPGGLLHSRPSTAESSRPFLWQSGGHVSLRPEDGTIRYLPLPPMQPPVPRPHLPPRRPTVTAFRPFRSMLDSSDVKWRGLEVTRAVQEPIVDDCLGRSHSAFTSLINATFKRCGSTERKPVTSLLTPSAMSRKSVTANSLTSQSCVGRSINWSSKGALLCRWRTCHINRPSCGVGTGQPPTKRVNTLSVPSSVPRRPRLLSNCPFPPTPQPRIPPFYKPFLEWSLDPLVLNSALNINSSETALWQNGLFGRTTPRQLSYTVAFLLARLFGLRTNQDFQGLKCDQFKLVIADHVAGSSTSVVLGEIDLKILLSCRVSIDALLQHPMMRLLYCPDREISVTCQSSVTGLVGHKSSLKGYIIDHFAENGHARCLVCLHTLLTSKRPLLGPESYFLAWNPDPSDQNWFLPCALENRQIADMLRAMNLAVECAILGPPETNKPQCSPCSDASPLNLVIAHPTCMDYWPELAERARQSAWQCTDCKTCAACDSKHVSGDLFVCDACDKGFHAVCLPSGSSKLTDRSLPWVCSECQDEGYRVAIGTLPDDSLCNGDTTAANRDTNLSTKSSNASAPDGPPPAIKRDLFSQDNSLSKASASDPANENANEQIETAEVAPPNNDKTSAAPLQESSDDQSPHNLARECTNTTPQHSKDSLSTISATPTLNGLDNSQSNSSTLPVPHQSKLDKKLDSTNDILPTDFREWSVDNVRTWLLEQGFTRESESFSQQEIDGACLVLMKRMDVLTELGIKLGPAVKIYERIKHLQAQLNGNGI